MSYMKQSKKRKRTLESAQLVGLEIIFNYFEGNFGVEF